jgi:hypothetical protein
MFKLFSRNGKQVVTGVEQVTEKTIGMVDGYVAPIRKTFTERFPVTFLLLVTTGVIATFLGVEQMILKYSLFSDTPELILIIGISILAITGTIHKKLG